MFLTLQSEESKNKYFELLKIIGGLSVIFSDSSIPYLYYRAAENVFCKAFDADNLSRSDCSVDARKDDIGVGLKTYINNNGRTFQKVAEFNRQRHRYMSKPTEREVIIEIANMKNKRVESTKIIHGVDKIMYHCVAREKDRFLVFEEEMDYIDTNCLSNISLRGNSLTFNDNLNEYNFNISKSTLLKRFNTPSTPTEINIEILKDPFDLLENCYYNNFITSPEVVDNNEAQHVILPLYSPVYNQVMSKSGLNQWNASGRSRNLNEVYIPVPMIIHRKHPSFFPLKDHSFNLVLPNKKIIPAKMCQNALMEIDGQMIDKGKGLMSNPNTDLGKWILRDILNISPGEVVTMEDLYSIGIDSVEIRKINNDYFEIDFKEIGSYEDFILN